MNSLHAAGPAQSVKVRRPLRLSNRMVAHAVSLAVLVALFAAWVVVARHVSSLIIPAPSKVVQQLGAMARSGALVRDTRITVEEVALGFLVGTSCAVLLAMALSQSRLLRDIVMPYVIVAQALPKFALVPIFVIWLGFGMLPKILVAAINAFFPVLLNTYLGATTVPSELSRLFDSFEAGRWAQLRRLTLPSALPAIFAGARIGSILALLGAIISEYIGSSRGLGAVLITAQGTLSVDLMFADFLVLTVVGLAVVKAVDLVEALVMRALWGRAISRQRSWRTSTTISV